jgi:hypothetical protein
VIVIEQQGQDGEDKVILERAGDVMFLDHFDQCDVTVIDGGFPRGR